MCIKFALLTVLLYFATKSATKHSKRGRTKSLFMVKKIYLKRKYTRFVEIFQIKRDTRKKIDPKDFTIENKSNETIIKMPGSINGMQFLIQNLEVFVIFY